MLIISVSNRILTHIPNANPLIIPGFRNNLAQNYPRSRNSPKNPVNRRPKSILNEIKKATFMRSSLCDIILFLKQHFVVKCLKLRDIDF